MPRLPDTQVEAQEVRGRGSPDSRALSRAKAASSGRVPQIQAISELALEYKPQAENKNRGHRAGQAEHYEEARPNHAQSRKGQWKEVGCEITYGIL